jgi:hypothetical protein
VFKLQYCQSKQKYICIIYNNSWEIFICNMLFILESSAVKMFIHPELKFLGCCFRKTVEVLYEIVFQLLPLMTLE